MVFSNRLLLESELRLDRLRNETETTLPTLSPHQDRQIAIVRCIRTLQHACLCKDTNCPQTRCHKMKRVVAHTKVCSAKQHGNCPICKRLIALVCYHANRCAEKNCHIPYCVQIKRKLNQRRLENRLQELREMQKATSIKQKHTAIKRTRPTSSAVANDTEAETEQAIAKTKESGTDVSAPKRRRTRKKARR